MHVCSQFLPNQGMQMPSTSLRNQVKNHPQKTLSKLLKILLLQVHPDFFATTNANANHFLQTTYLQKQNEKSIQLLNSRLLSKKGDGTGREASTLQNQQSNSMHAAAYASTFQETRPFKISLTSRFKTSLLNWTLHPFHKYPPLVHADATIPQNLVNELKSISDPKKREVWILNGWICCILGVCRLLQIKVDEKVEMEVKDLLETTGHTNISRKMNQDSRPFKIQPFSKILKIKDLDALLTSAFPPPRATKPHFLAKKPKHLHIDASSLSPAQVKSLNNPSVYTNLTHAFKAAGFGDAKYYDRVPILVSSLYAKKAGILIIPCDFIQMDSAGSAQLVSYLKENVLRVWSEFNTWKLY